MRRNRGRNRPGLSVFAPPGGVGAQLASVGACGATGGAEARSHERAARAAKARGCCAARPRRRASLTGAGPGLHAKRWGVGGVREIIREDCWTRAAGGQTLGRPAYCRGIPCLLPNAAPCTRHGWRAFGVVRSTSLCHTHTVAAVSLGDRARRRAFVLHHRLFDGVQGFALDGHQAPSPPCCRRHDLCLALIPDRSCVGLSPGKIRKIKYLRQ